MLEIPCLERRSLCWNKAQPATYHWFNRLKWIQLRMVDRYGIRTLHGCLPWWMKIHYSDVIMSAMASQITGLSIVSSIACSGADQRKHQNSASLAFVRGIHQWPVGSPHIGPVTRECFHLVTSSWITVVGVYYICNIYGSAPYVLLEPINPPNLHENK